MNIKAIIFDLGGPIVEWQAEMYGVYKKYEELHGLKENALRDILQDYMHRGGIGEFHSFPEFVEATKPAVPLTLEQLNQVFEEGNAAMWVRPEMVEYIQELKKKYPIALLSNFMYGLEDFLKNIFKIHDLFDVIVSSHDVRMRKPDPKIYQYTLEKLGIDPEAAVFIDDMEENVAGATALGIAGIVFKDSNQCRADLNSLLGRLDDAKASD